MNKTGLWRMLCAALAGLTVLQATAAAADDTVDPLASVRWAQMRAQFTGADPLVFDERVRVIAPEVAENPLQVPVTVDASALPGIEEVVVFADFNPIEQVLRYYPSEVPAYLGFRLKLQQSSPVRAAARTRDGRWHVGGAWVNTVGGGCTAPTGGAAEAGWATHLNEVQGRLWSSGPQAGRLRLRILHPMDTGLIAGTPAFHLDELRFSTPDGRLLMRVQTYEPVATNPVFTLQPGLAEQGIVVEGRDNNGNRLQQRITP